MVFWLFAEHSQFLLRSNRIGYFANKKIVSLQSSRASENWQRAGFQDQQHVWEVLINDCGGHGRAFGNVGQETAQDLWRRNTGRKRRPFNRQGCISPLTPSETSIYPIKGSDTRSSLSKWLNPLWKWWWLVRYREYLRLPYIWLLALCITYPDKKFLSELRLLDYRDFQAKENPTMPRDFSWVDFEKLMIRIRKMKSHVFQVEKSWEWETCIGMCVCNRNTDRIHFINHHLYDDVATHQIETQTRLSNEQT